MLERSRLVALIVALVLAGGACAQGDEASQPAPAPSPAPGASAGPAATLTLPPGFTSSVAVDGLVGPTQMVLGPDGRLWVAQLAGGEGANTGQIVTVDLTNGNRQVVLDGLAKPTGVAVVDGFVWVALERDLVRAPLRPDGVGPIEVLLRELPYNGRSNGTLTVTPDNTLLYVTSGAQAGAGSVPGSGTLWELDPDAPRQPRRVATGLKNAYAHTYDAAGRLWTTEVSDGSYDGRPPPDEVNPVDDGASYGWPRCIGDRTPVLEFNTTPAFCARTGRPAAVFTPGATPTGLTMAPWQPDTLLVALWTQGTVVAVPAVLPDGPLPEPQVFLGGVETPQHLLALPDGTLLLSEHTTGRVWRIARGG